MNDRSLSSKANALLIDELIELRLRVQELETAETERQRALDAMRENEEKYRILLDESSDPIFSFYPDGQYRYVNKAFADGVQRKMEEIIGRKIWDVFPQDEADKRYAAVKWVFENGVTKVIEVRVPRSDGDRYYLTTVKPVFNMQNKVISVICISKEITDRRRMEEELRQANERLNLQLNEIETLQNNLREQAIRDSLTGLYNRGYLNETLERELAHAGRDQSPVSVVMMDVDEFKHFNDYYGHKAGDEVLRALSSLLGTHTRRGDIACRFGGDEFAVIMPEAPAQVALKRAEEWRTVFEHTNIINDRLILNATFSGGIATFPDHGATPDELFHTADEALYAAKAAGRNRIVLYGMGL